MKIRTDFITNSSSSSFIIAINRFETKENVDKLNIFETVATNESRLKNIFEGICNQYYGTRDIEELYYQEPGMLEIYDDCKEYLDKRYSIGVTDYLEYVDQDYVKEVLKNHGYTLIKRLDY